MAIHWKLVEREQAAAKSNPSSHSVIECLHIVRAISARAEGFSQKEGWSGEEKGWGEMLSERHRKNEPASG